VGLIGFVLYIVGFGCVVKGSTDLIVGKARKTKNKGE